MGDRTRSDDALPPPAVGLDDLLMGIARGLTSAQEELDRAARNTADVLAALPAGEVHLRPLWFVFERTTVELELSTFTARGTQLQCRALDPVAVALRGHAQSSGTRVRVEIAPLGAEMIRRE